MPRKFSLPRKLYRAVRPRPADNGSAYGKQSKTYRNLARAREFAGYAGRVYVTKCNWDEVWDDDAER